MVLGGEPIGRYDARFVASAWPDDVIARCLAANVTRHDLSEVVAFAAATTGYATPLRRTAWPTSVRAWLLTPAVDGGGGMVRTPTAIGHATAALIEHHTLDHA